MFVPIRNFGQYGVIHDTVGETLPVGAWTDARNMRFSGREMEKMLEPTLEEAFTPGGGILQQGWSDSISTYVAVATQTEIYFLQSEAGTGGTWVLAGAGYSEDGEWQAFAWGDTCIFNNGVDAPQVFDQSTQTFIDLPKWGLISTAEDITNGSAPTKDTKASCKVLLPYKNFLVALGVSENGLYQPNTTWWSNTTTLAGLATSVIGSGPPDWDYESPASLSGKTEIGVGDGPIAWGAPLNENVIVYTDGSASALTFVGGTFVMATRRLFNKGCAGLHLAAEFNNRHFVIARDQIYVHDGSTVQLVAKDRVEDEFFKRAGKGGRYGGDGDIDYTTMRIVKNPDRKELLVLFNGFVLEELFGDLEVPDDFELVQTAVVRMARVAGYRDSWGNNGYIHSDGKGTVLAFLDGGWNDFTIEDEEGYVYRSDDYGQNWTVTDAREVIPAPDSSGENRIWSIAYDATISRWWLRNYSANTQVQYSDDGGNTFYNVKDPNVNLALGSINLSSFGVNYVEGSRTAVMIAGNSYRADISQYYRAAGYWVDTGGTSWEQQYGRAALNSPSDNYQLMGYQGRHLSGLRFGSEWHLYGVEEFENAVSEPISYGAFPGTHQWASKGDGIILAATGDMSVANWGYIEYQRADVRDPNNVTITTHRIETSFDYIAGSATEIYCNGDYFIAYTIKVADSLAVDGFRDVALFISEDGENWGEQINLTLPTDPQFSAPTKTTFKATYAGGGAWLFTYGGPDEKHRIVRLFINYPGVTYQRRGRFALVYNFEDDNYTWMDAAVSEDDGSLTQVIDVHYRFTPGWVVRWNSATIAALTWADAGAADSWGDFASAGREKNMYWLTAGGVYLSDQVVGVNNAKSYFVERLQMDLDDLNPKWTTNMVKHLRQVVFHLQGVDVVDSPNTFDISAGWAQNLMDQPVWTVDGTVELNTTANGGKYKWDVRTVGRYLSLRMDFSATERIAMTGADIDVEPRYGH